MEKGNGNDERERKGRVGIEVRIAELIKKEDQIYSLPDGDEKENKYKSFYKKVEEELGEEGSKEFYRILEVRYNNRKEKSGDDRFGR